MGDSATIRADEGAREGAGVPLLGGDAADDLPVVAVADEVVLVAQPEHEVLERAVRVELGSRVSAREAPLAAAAYEGVSFEGGIGETFVAAHRVRHRPRGG